MLHRVQDQLDADAIHAQFDRVVEALGEKLPAVAEHLDAARADIVAFQALVTEPQRERPDRPPQWPARKPGDASGRRGYEAVAHVQRDHLPHRERIRNHATGHERGPARRDDRREQRPRGQLASERPETTDEHHLGHRRS